jgi:hypothetical protein
MTPNELPFYACAHLYIIPQFSKSPVLTFNYTVVTNSELSFILVHIITLQHIKQYEILAMTTLKAYSMISSRNRGS